MVGSGRTWWKYLVAISSLTAVFLVAGFFVSSPKAFAAPQYDWVDNLHVKVTGYDYPQYSGNESSFTFTCAGTAPIYTCVTERGNGNGQTGFCGPQLNFSEDSSRGFMIARELSAPAVNGQPVPPCRDVFNPPAKNVAVGSTDKGPSDLTNQGNGPDTNEEENENLQFECGKFSPLNWVLCPLYLGINSFVGFIDNTINTLLTVDQKQIFDTETPSGEGYYKAWQTLRSFALALLLIAGLVMVIAQALGLQVLDAYTVKKVLPRLLIAVIAISLSWEIMEFFVVLTNNLGLGIRQIIYFPFRDMPGSLSLGGGSAFVGALIGSGALLALGVTGLLSFAATAALAALVAFLVLMVRQLVIVVLILVAPIAIACSILPNTQGAYKLWYESFTKALLMFPIIVAFIAVGRVFSVVAIQGDITKVTAVSQLIGFAAYFLPYFLIPLTFSLAGGAMRFIGGQINDRNRGGFDRLKKFRGTKVQGNMHAMKEGNRFRGNNMFARGFNRATENIATAPEAGLNPWTMRSRFQAAKAQSSFGAAEEIRTKNADFALGAQDDRLLKGVQGRGRADIRRILAAEGVTAPEMDTAIGTVERMQKTGSRDAVLQAAALQRFATGTGYNVDGEFNYAQAYDTLVEASEGDRAVAGRLLGSSKGIAAQAGQLAWGGASYGTLNAGMNQAWDGGGAAVQQEAIALNAFTGNDGASWARARAPHVQAAYRAATNRINALRDGSAQPTDAGELGRLTAQLQSSGMLASQYGAPEKQTIIGNEMAGSQDTRRAVETEVNADLQRYAEQEYTAQYSPYTQQRITPQVPLDPNTVQNQRNTYRGRQVDPNDPRMQDPDQ